MVRVKLHRQLLYLTSESYHHHAGIHNQTLDVSQISEGDSIRSRRRRLSNTHNLWGLLFITRLNILLLLFTNFSLMWGLLYRLILLHLMSPLGDKTK